MQTFSCLPRILDYNVFVEVSIAKALSNNKNTFSNMAFNNWLLMDDQAMSYIRNF